MDFVFVITINPHPSYANIIPHFKVSAVGQPSLR